MSWGCFVCSGALFGSALLYSALALVVRRWRPRSPQEVREFRRKHRLCLTRGYDLTGNVSGVCPECGTKSHQY